MLASVRDELRFLMYHPRFSSDGERGRRIASAFLGRRFRHGDIDLLDDKEAVSLASHLRGRMTDNAPAAVQKAVEHIVNRQ